MVKTTSTEDATQCTARLRVILAANVNSRSRSLYVVVRPSVVCLSVVCNVRAPYSGDWNFRQCFYTIWYLGHPWPFSKNFAEKKVIGKKHCIEHCIQHWRTRSLLLCTTSKVATESHTSVYHVLSVHNKGGQISDPTKVPANPTYL